MRIPWRMLRRGSQLTAAGLLVLPVVWSANPVWLGTYLSSRFLGMALADPWAAVEVTAAGKTVWWPLLGATVPLVLAAALLGRVFCGWICPLNTVFELAACVKKPAVRSEPNTFQPYWLLAALLATAALAGFPVYTAVSPIGIVARALAFGAGIELAGVFVLVAADLWYERKGWCRRFCPAGAFYGLLSRWRVLRVGADEERCRHCGRCRAACSMGVDIGSGRPLDAMACINCGDCIDACPEQAVRYTWNATGKERGEHDESGQSVTR